MPRPTSRASSFLPDVSRQLGTSSSFADEVQLDMQHRLDPRPHQKASGSVLFPSAKSARSVAAGTPKNGQGAAGRDEYEDGLGRNGNTGSVLFPSVPARRPSQSSPIADSGGFRDSTATVLAYSGDHQDRSSGYRYGSEVQQQQQQRHVSRTGGPRPASRSSMRSSMRSRAAHPGRLASTFSAEAARGDGESTRATTALDYLVLDEERGGGMVGPEGDDEAGESSRNPRNGAQAGSGGLAGKGRIDPAYVSYDQSPEMSRQHDGPSAANEGYRAPPVPSVPHDHDVGERAGDDFSKEEAWYFLRALVGQEIRHEEGLLWKLKDLDAKEDVFRNGHDEPYDESIAPGEVPILRYLIRHFLLTLPLVRDVASPTEVPMFWTNGLYPIIRAVHDADFSKPIDRGGASSVASKLYDSSIRNALERFVAAGLKLSSPDSSASSPTAGSEAAYEDGAPAMSRVPTSASPTRYNFQPTLSVPAPSNRSGTLKKGKARSTPPARSPSLSSTNRFSFSRLFGNAPSKNGLPALGASTTTLRSPIPTFPLPPSSLNLRPASSIADGASISVGSTAHSLSPPIPHLSPIMKGSIEQFGSPPIGSSSEGESPVDSTFKPNFHRPSTANSAISRATGLTSGVDDAASFVSARETTASRTTEHSEADEEDLTTRFPVVGSTLGGGQDAVMREPPTDTEGFEYYPSDAANTPVQEYGGFTFPHGEKRESREVEPYVVDDTPASSLSAPPSTAPLQPPRTTITPASPPRTTNGVPPRSPPSSPPQGKDRSSKFGLASLLRNKRGRSQSIDSVSESSPAPPTSPGWPASRRLPPSAIAASGPIYQSDFVAHMAIPTSLMFPQAPLSPIESEVSPSNDGVAPGPPVLLQKRGVEWPYSAAVAFAPRSEFDLLKWGGFEADIVGVRKGIFTHSYIIRVRRPARLDEYVVRSEAQFLKFYRLLDKAFPNAHIRRIPTGDPKNDTIIRPRPFLPTIGSTTSFVADAEKSSTSVPSAGRSRLAVGLRAAAADPHNGERPLQSRNSTSGGSTFARSLRAQSLHSLDEAKMVRARRARSATLSTFPSRPGSATGSYRSVGATSLGSRMGVTVEIGKKMPPLDPRRRALRTWLRDVLAVRTVGHHTELARFLLLGSMVPKDADVIDMMKRELIDDARRTARIAPAQSAAEKVRTMRNYWSTVEDEIIQHDGLADISAALKAVPRIEKLPLKYQKVLESLRFNFAETLFDLLVDGEDSGSTFAKFKSLHAAFPYFLVRQALRIKGSGLMARALQDILIGRPFGGKSLLQKILATTLDDDPARLAHEMDCCRTRIGSTVMTEKLELFVHAEGREKKAIIRRYAEESGIELVLCIVRGSDEPRLPGYELDRVAQKAYRRFIKTNPSPLMKANAKDPDVRLVLDLQIYLRLASRDRDAVLLRELLANEDFAAAIEVVAAPFVALLKRTYRVGNASQALSDLQAFFNQLIIIVEALRSRIQDPQKSIRVLARLLGRHQQSLHTFLRSIHRNETIVEETLQWFWTASVFLRRGLAEPVKLDHVVPPDLPEEKAYLLDELEELTAYHTKKRFHAYQAACRRFAGDVDADDPILVEGDGKGKSQVEPIVEPEPSPPLLSEIPLYAAAFRQQLKNIFAF
ncbi:hypothetical protein JCM21900_001099 [Sporobolomyces salmonicolor]